MKLSSPLMAQLQLSKSVPLSRLEILEGRVLVSFILVPRADPAQRGPGVQGRRDLVFAWVGRAAGGDAAASLLPLVFCFSGVN